MGRVEKWQLQQRQGLPLDIKIQLSLRRIEEFYNAFDGQIYVSYSGGKDSEVLLHLAKTVNPNIKSVFVDTGTEIHTREHAISKADIILKPRISMLKVWVKYGIPFPSKQQANFIYKAKHTKSEYLRSRLLTGIMRGGEKTMFKIAEKWKTLIDSDIEVSDKCCYYLKKEPFKRYNKESGEKPMIGTMATDGMERRKQYLQNGCINYDKNVATPLGFWTEQDILRYIKRFNLNYCGAYGDIIDDGGILKTTKEKRTGCVGCLFGIHLETEPNRLQRLAVDDPRMWDIILNKWVDGRIKVLLDLFRIPYYYPVETQQKLFCEARTCGR